MKNGRISYDELEKQNLILKQELNRFREQQNLLHLSELRFRMLYENSLDAILLTSPGGSIYSANAKACILFGLSEQELRSKGRASIIDKSDRRVNEAIEFRNKHGYFYGQMTFIRSDNTKFEAELSSNIFKDADGNSWTSMIIRDITERKLAEQKIQHLNKTLETKVRERTKELLKTNIQLNEEITIRTETEKALRESELKFRHFFEEDLVGYFITNANGVLKDCNYAYLDIFGYKSKDEIIGQNIQIFYPDVNEFDKIVAMLKQHGSIKDYETKRISKGGKLINIVENKILNLDKEGQIVEIKGFVQDITERKIVEATLFDAQQCLLFHVKNSPLAIIEWDEYFVVRRWTGAAETIFGWTAEEAIGKSVHELDIIFEEDKTGMESAILNVVNLSNDKSVIEIRNTTKNRDLIYCEWHNSLFFEKNSNEISIISQVLDLTIRKNAERALKEREARYHLILDYSNFWEVFRDENGKLIYSSPAFEALTGYDNQDFIDGTVGHFDFVHPEDKSIAMQKFSEALNQKSFIDFEFRILTKDEKIKYVTASIQQIYVDKDTYIGFRVSIKDITEQKLREQAILDSEKNTLLLMNSAAEGIYGIDLFGNCTFVNNSCISLLGYDNENDFIGKDMHLLTHHSFADKQKMSVDKCKINLAFIKGEKSHEVDEVFWQKNGKAIPVEYFSYPQYKENKIVGAVVTFTDISERLEAEKLLKESEEKYRMQSEILTKFNKEYLSINEELKRYVEEIQTLNDTLANQNNELHELNATKDKFLSILAHDLKNPFNILIGFSSLLVKNALKYQPEKIQEFSKTINDVSVNSYALLENLLEWSKLQTGKLVPNPVNIDLAELISEVSQFTDHMSKAKNIQFLLDMSCTTQIWADKEMIKTVLRNLLTNALKFTKPGGNVSLMTRCQEKAVLIEVADTGIGIEAKHLDNLFKIDSKLSRTGTADEKGTGLGLILCKEFVEINNGEIWVESEIDMGSTFKFTVPLFQMEN